jgi:hypothetical protein
MDLQELKAWLETNKDNAEVKAYLDSFKVQPTLEVFKSKLNDADFKSFLDSEKDKHLSKGIETFKSNNLSKLVDEEVKKRYPEKDAKDIQVEALRIELEKMKKENLMKEIKNQAILILDEKKLPKEVLNFIVSDDLEKTKTNIESFGNVFNPYIQIAVEERIKSGSYTPPKNNDSTTKNPWSKEHFNLTEQGRIITENPLLASQLMAQATK